MCAGDALDGTAAVKARLGMMHGRFQPFHNGHWEYLELTAARCETLMERPAYRTPFRFRRCLVPADGFYEWQRVGSRKQPFFIGDGMARTNEFG